MCLIQNKTKCSMFYFSKGASDFVRECQRMCRPHVLSSDKIWESQGFALTLWRETLLRYFFVYAQEGKRESQRRSSGCGLILK